MKKIVLSSLFLALVAAQVAFAHDPRTVAKDLSHVFAIEGAGKYLEFSIEGPDYYPWQEGLFVKSPYTVEAGHVTISDEPGWGVEIDPEWLAKSSYRVSERS